MCTPDVLNLTGLCLNSIGTILLVLATPVPKKSGTTWQDFDPNSFRWWAYRLGFPMLALGFVLQLTAQLVR